MAGGQSNAWQWVFVNLEVITDASTKHLLEKSRMKREGGYELEEEDEGRKQRWTREPCSCFKGRETVATIVHAASAGVSAGCRKPHVVRRPPLKTDFAALPLLPRVVILKCRVALCAKVTNEQRDFSILVPAAYLRLLTFVKTARRIMTGCTHTMRVKTMYSDRHMIKTITTFNCHDLGWRRL